MLITVLLMGRSVRRHRQGSRLPVGEDRRGTARRSSKVSMITPRRDPEILLRRYWENPDTPVVTAGLTALSVGYRLALGVRERAYRWRVLRTGRSPCPVVSVGNITLGGSGKTPMVEEVARALRELGAVPAVVSRGYGRDTRGPA